MASHQYFAQCTTVEQIKAAYKKLAFQHHPDLGGDTATMQLINAQYEAALRGVDGQESVGSDGHVHRYKYSRETEQKLMEKISQLIALKMEGVDVYLIGTWLWVQGDTKPYKTQLGRDGAGLRWHSTRGCWYYNPTEGRYFGSNKSLGELAATYGVEKVDLGDQKVAAERQLKGKKGRKSA